MSNSYIVRKGFLDQVSDDITLTDLRELLDDLMFRGVMLEIPKCDDPISTPAQEES